jgi:hypothetical protein
MHTFITVLICVLALGAALGVSVFIVFANGMSDAPNKPFDGGWLIVAAWIVALLIVAARVF